MLEWGFLRFPPCASLVLLSSDWRRWASALLYTSDQGSLPLHSHCLSILSFFFPVSFSLIHIQYIHISHLNSKWNKSRNVLNGFISLVIYTVHNLLSIAANTMKKKKSRKQSRPQILELPMMADTAPHFSTFHRMPEFHPPTCSLGHVLRNSYIQK